MRADFLQLVPLTPHLPGPFLVAELGGPVGIKKPGQGPALERESIDIRSLPS